MRVDDDSLEPHFPAGVVFTIDPTASLEVRRPAHVTFSDQRRADGIYFYKGRTNQRIRFSTPQSGRCIAVAPKSLRSVGPVIRWISEG